MKILSKQEIAATKSSDRKREIDEGVKLARKIDLLRETAAKEGENLAKFREESLKILKKEIIELVTEKQKLSKEVGMLQEEKLKIRKVLEQLHDSSPKKSS